MRGCVISTRMVYGGIGTEMGAALNAVGSTQRRRYFRFVEWTLRRADDEPDMPPGQHQFRCLGEDEDGTPCGAEGPLSEDFATAQSWPFEHAKEAPEHRTYAHAPVIPWVIAPREEPQ